tara:strand:- start:26 stop:157 length:132 start_codon:yes stop_codon:yes gene_type:complete
VGIALAVRVWHDEAAWAHPLERHVGDGADAVAVCDEPADRWEL